MQHSRAPAEEGPISVQSLSRLEITGPIGPDMPYVVLEEIMAAHGLQLADRSLPLDQMYPLIRDQLNTLSVPVVAEPYQRADYTLIARFVNAQTTWPIRDLVLAYNVLRAFMKPGRLRYVTDDFEVGIQTPASPRRLNGCVLYGICREAGIKVTSTMTLADMTWCVRMLRGGVASIRSYLNDQLNQPRRLSSLINAGLALMVDPTDPPEPNPEMLVTFEDLQQTARRPGHLTIPTTPAEAIVLGALRHDSDLSAATNPLVAYRLLPSRRDLFPRLDQVFNHRLPMELYTPSALRRLLEQEGLTSVGMGSWDEIPGLQTPEATYEMLLILRWSNTFHPGKQPRIGRQTAVYFLDLDDLSPDEVVSYGVREEPMRCYTYDELATTFNTYLTFTDPASTTGEAFTETSIRKLFYLANQDPEAEDRRRLIDAILRTRDFLDATASDQRDFIRNYTTYPDHRQASIIECLMRLHRLAMFMRGWDGLSSLPIRVARVDDQLHVDLLVTQAMADFFTACEVSPDGTTILDLPLVRYHGGRFQRSVSVSDGLTIRQRLEIVQDGVDSDSIESCIRLSSNWLAATSYWYLDCLGRTPNYNISDLASIS